MKKLLTTDPEEIREELQRIVDKKTTLFCLRQGVKKSRHIYGSGFSWKKDVELLVLYHPHAVNCEKDSCTYYYHTKGSPLRYFTIKKAEKVEKYLRVYLPEKLYEIQRRSAPRVVTPNDSVMTFSVINKQRVFYASVTNVSENGVRCVGDLHAVISPGDSLMPISLSLYSKLLSKEETYLHIPEATVAWSIIWEERTIEMGIKFDLSGSLKEVLGNYIDCRNVEDSVGRS